MSAFAPLVVAKRSSISAQSWTLQLRSPGIERALPSAMVATDAVNLSLLWADDRTALG